MYTPTYIVDVEGRSRGGPYRCGDGSLGRSTGQCRLVPSTLPQSWRCGGLLGAVEAYWIPVHEGAILENMNPVVVNNVERMTGIFMGGGDQARLITSLEALI